MKPHPIALAPLLAFSFAVSCLFGCGSSESPSGGPSGVQPGSGGTTTSPDGGSIPGPGTGGTIDLNPQPDSGPGPDTAGGGGGANTAVQCNGKFTGRLRDFVVAQGENGRPLDPDIVPAVAVTLDGVDYVASPDFEFANNMINPATAMGKRFGPDPGLVQATLGMDRTPVYAGPAEGTVTTTGPANFATWFHDTPGVNLGQNLTLQFERDPAKPEDPNAYYFDSSTMGCGAATCQGFFPIDGQLLGNQGNRHNYHMTFELHLQFKYHAGAVFTFIGDDDIWVFIDNKLALDLGGTHNEVTGTIMLDTLGLTEGQIYDLAFFWCERHVTGSNLRIETSLEVTNCGEPVVK